MVESKAGLRAVMMVALMALLWAERTAVVSAVSLIASMGVMKAVMMVASKVCVRVVWWAVM